MVGIQGHERDHFVAFLPPPATTSPAAWYNHDQDGVTIQTSPEGTARLVSVKSIPLTGWKMAVWLPAAEVFTPVTTMEHRMLWATLFLTLLAGIATQGMLRLQLEPLLSTANTLSTLSQSDTHPQPLPIFRQDEVGRLIGGFNRLLEAIGEREERLREKETLFQTAFAQASVGMVLTDANFKPLQTNEAFSKISGYSAQELSSLGIMQLTHPEDCPSKLALYQQLFTGETSAFETETRYIRKDATIIWVRNSVSLTRDTLGHPACIIQLSEDVTERRRAQDLLAAQNQAMAAVAQQLDLPLVLQMLVRVSEEFSGRDVMGSIMLVDESRACLVHGAAPSLPDSYNQAVHGVKIDPDIGTCAAAAARKEIVITPDIASAPSWKPYAALPLDLGLVSCWSMPILSSTGQILGTFGTYSRALGAPGKQEQDLIYSLSQTASLAIERWQANLHRERLLHSERAARGDAERATRMKNEFLSTLSHELRTPLNAISLWTDLLKLNLRQSDPLEEGLAAISRNTQLQATLVEDLLDMSRIEAGQLRLEMKLVHLSTIISAAVDTVRLSAEAKGIQFELLLDPEEGPVQGDPERLQQLIGNLLTNSVKYTPERGLVTVRSEWRAAHVVISVSDNGEGMSAEFLPHIFDRFRQEDASSTRRLGGLGLGLALAKQLAELHRGRLRALSAGKGLGATFTLELPLMLQEGEPGVSYGPLFASGNKQEVHAPYLQGITVLVIDDESDTRRLVKHLIEAEGGQVLTASSAKAGLILFQERTPDVVLSDIGMPEHDGYEFLRWVRALEAGSGRRTPMAAFTAFARSEDRENALQAGFQIHLVKPINAATLIAAISQLVGLRTEPSHFTRDN